MSKLVQAIHCVKAIESGATECQLQNDKLIKIGLMSFVNMKNCIRFFQTAEEISADLLKDHCSELISNHWVCISFRMNQNFQAF
jgi:hypothetical protein